MPILLFGMLLVLAHLCKNLSKIEASIKQKLKNSVLNETDVISINNIKSDNNCTVYYAGVRDLLTIYSIDNKNSHLPNPRLEPTPTPPPPYV